MILNGFLFFDENSTTQYSEELVCSTAKQLTLSVISDDSVILEIFGLVDYEHGYDSGDGWIELAAINASDLSISSKITEAGIYYIPLNGINLVSITNSGTPGSVTVFGTLTD